MGNIPNNETIQSHGQVCDLCGCASYQVFATKGRWGSVLTTVICQECGLVYSNPRPTAEENAEFYHKKYWGLYKGQSAPDERFFNRRIPKIRSMLGMLRPFLKEGVSVLEIGCGVGALLWSLKQSCDGKGNFVGIEPHEGHARFCRDSKELDVHAGLLDEVAPKFEPKSFDLVVMNHVLEHTISPTEVFTMVKSLLRPGGHFVVEVPNIQAPGSRLSHFFHVAHHFNFSPRTLQRLGMKTGFKINRIEELDGDLERVRLLGVFENHPKVELDVPHRFIRDDAGERAIALQKYDQWYWFTLASIRKKFTHWLLQRG
ncbi:MAG: class I SAM-dependent methyltransferase [Verrucomicrobiae bacterium]|jgi:2-polyprenyl-3-methyl-5-hydroxy-6-metoxy-1,4-benzoquinol methylase|nr:class I SAM-dependent methyltransferase [Verrucomicrobiae bacterium]